jgi:Leucine-rich repeat (LRR) protein
MTSPSAQSRNRKRPRPERPGSPTRERRETRPQPSAEDDSHLQAVGSATHASATRFIPLDLVQNAAEYLGRVTDLLSFRGVSTAWQSAVCDALGYLNDRCWTRFALGKCDGALWTLLRVDDPIVVARCAVLCLRPRLETVEWIGNNNNIIIKEDTVSLPPLQLLGENNTTLTALNLAVDKLVDTAHLRELRGLKWLRLHVPDLKVSVLPIIGTLHTLEVLDLTSHPVTNLTALRGLMALRELTLQSTPVTDRYFAGLKHVLARLHKLDLSGCRELTTISNLAPCVSLRELNLAWSGVEDLQGLEKLVALETLDVIGIPARDWSVVRQCPRLVALTARISGSHLLKEIQAMVDNAAHCLVQCRLSAQSPRAHRRTLTAWERLAKKGFLRYAVLRELDLCGIGVNSASIQGIAEIPVLQVLNLSRNPIDNVRALAGCRALRDLCLNDTQVTDEGIVGLDRIVTLEKLGLDDCLNLTSVTKLRHCGALRELSLGSPRITNAGIEGLGRIATLTKLSLDRCEVLTSVSSLRYSPSLRELNIAYTPVTAAGIAGLEEIGTLEQLDASCCGELYDVTTLRRCRALRVLDLSSSSVVETSMAALACVATLESLNLSDNAQIRDVSRLSESMSLRELDLRYTKVDDAGLAGLELIPTLTSLQLARCRAVTDLRHLIRSKSLRRLSISSGSLNDVGIEGIETASVLQFLELKSCPRIVDIAAVRRRAAEHAVRLHFATCDSDDAETESTEEEEEECGSSAHSSS